MDLIIIGPPGAGKGTQAEILATSLAGMHISPGELLRSQAESGELPDNVAQMMRSGELVPDEYLDQVMAQYLRTKAAGKLVIFDGFPRDLKQVELLERMLKSLNREIGKVIFLNVTEPNILQRINLRAGKQGRLDDDPEALVKRLEVYATNTPSVIEHFKKQGKLIEIDGNPDIDTVTSLISRALQAQPEVS